MIGQDPPPRMTKDNYKPNPYRHVCSYIGSRHLYKYLIGVRGKQTFHEEPASRLSGQSRLFNTAVVTSVQFSHSVVSHSLRPHELQTTRLLCPWNSGKNTRVGCHALLQGIFLTQGQNPGLPQCRQILCHLSHQVSNKLVIF